LKKNTELITHHLLWRSMYFFSVLLINIGIARFFAAGQSGQIFYIVNNLSFILLLVSLSLESGTAYFIASGKLESVPLARFCAFWTAGASLIALGIWWLFMPFLHVKEFNRGNFLLPSFLFIAGVLLTTYFTAIFYARKEFGTPNMILCVANGLLILLLIFERNNNSVKNHFLEIYFSIFFLQGLILGTFFFLNRTGHNKSFLPTGTDLKKVFRYSLIALLANGLYFLVNRADYWFVQYYCTATDLGNYIQAAKLGQMLLIIPSILGSTLFPIFSSAERTGNISELTSVMRILLWMNILICIMIIAFGWYLFPLIFGPSFNSMYTLFVLLIPGILSFTLNYPLAAWFSAGNRMGINIRGTILALVIITAGDLLILPKSGVLFAPIISSAGYICYYGYSVFTYRKTYPVPWNEFFMIRKSDLERFIRMTGKKFLDSAAVRPLASNKNI
jgi:O-antigen/teichoic acid export membrane protein